MMQRPKVSVLISFYNLEPYVDQTLESVLAQKTDFPVEVLCADDGSDDGTIEKLRAWEQKRPDSVRVFVMDRTPGAKYEANERIRRMNAIRGRLFYEAKGEYVCYLDGDDFYTDEHKLQKQADILDADAGHRYIGCGHNGCYYWESTGKTQPIEKPLRECSLTAKEYWSFLYVHTNAMMLCFDRPDLEAARSYLDQKTGVYFLQNENRLYIGMSDTLFQRLNNHLSDQYAAYWARTRPQP